MGYFFIFDLLFKLLRYGSRPSCHRLSLGFLLPLRGVRSYSLFVRTFFRLNFCSLFSVNFKNGPERVIKSELLELFSGLRSESFLRSST